MTQLHNRLTRFEVTRTPRARRYLPNPQFTAQDNAHFARIHDMLEGLGRDELDTLLANIALNGGRLVEVLQ